MKKRGRNGLLVAVILLLSGGGGAYLALVLRGKTRSEQYNGQEQQGNDTPPMSHEHAIDLTIHIEIVEHNHELVKTNVGIVNNRGRKPSPAV